MSSGDDISGTGEIIGLVVALSIGLLFLVLGLIQTYNAWKNILKNKPAVFDETFSDKAKAIEFVRKNKDVKQQWETFLREHSDVGVLTLAFMHQNPDNFLLELYIKVLLSATPILQIAITIILFESQFSDYDKGFCPATTSTRKRILAFAIGFLYMIKVGLLLCEKEWKAHQVIRVKVAAAHAPASNADTEAAAAPSSTTELKLKALLNQTKTGGVLQYYVLLDRIMNMDYEFGVYIFNLWIVFLAKSPLDMVLNALAMEFIMQIDNELKAIYMNLYEPDDEMIARFLQANSYKSKSGEYGQVYDWIYIPLRHFFMIWLPVMLGALVHFGAILLPVCKA